MENFKFIESHKYLISTPEKRMRCEDLGFISQKWIEVAFRLCPKGTKVIDLTDWKVVLEK